MKRDVPFPIFLRKKMGNKNFSAADKSNRIKNNLLTPRRAAAEGRRKEEKGPENLDKPDL